MGGMPERCEETVEFLDEGQCMEKRGTLPAAYVAIVGTFVGHEELGGKAFSDAPRLAKDDARCETERHSTPKGG